MGCFDDTCLRVDPTVLHRTKWWAETPTEQSWDDLYVRLPCNCNSSVRRGVKAELLVEEQSRLTYTTIGTLFRSFHVIIHTATVPRISNLCVIQCWVEDLIKDSFNFYWHGKFQTIVGKFNSKSINWIMYDPCCFIWQFRIESSKFVKSTSWRYYSYQKCANVFCLCILLSFV